MSIEGVRSLFTNPFDVPANAEAVRLMLNDIFHPSRAFTLAPQTSWALEDTPASDMASILATVHSSIVPYAVNVRHPESLAHMVPPPASISVVADLIIGAMNQCAFIWEEAPCAYGLESEVLKWLNRQVGYGSTAGGLLTSGGTMSNVTAAYLALARARNQGVPDASACILTSDQAHLSIEKAALLTGLAPSNLIRVETDHEGRVQQGQLSHAALRARQAGKHPVMLVCTAGTTNAGTLEPVGEALILAKELNAWCHVDAAHGGAMCLVKEPGTSVKQWQQADSISWDPHKTLYASYAVGSLLVREKHFLDPLAFEADYALKADSQEDAGTNHIDGSRKLEALKVWMLIKHLGTSGLAQLTRHCCMLARRFAGHIRNSQSFRLLTYPDANIVCFRLKRREDCDLDADQLNSALQRALFLAGGPLLSTTILKDRVFLRSVFLNPCTSEADVDRIFNTIRLASDELLDREGVPAGAIP